MDIIDIEFEYECGKRRILAKIENLKEEWKRVWDKCSGNQEAEAEAMQVHLKIQLLEAEALDELKKLEEKIERVRNP